MANYLWIAVAVVSTIAVTICSVIVWLNIKRLKYRHLPGPKNTSFVFGSLAEFMKDFNLGYSFPEIVSKMFERYGPVVRLDFITTTVICVKDPDVVKECLVTGNFPRQEQGWDDFSWLFGKRFAGEGLVTVSDRKKWAKKRMLLNPLFTKSYIAKLDTDFNQMADALMDELEKVADGKTKVCMMDKFNLMTLDVIAKVAFAVELNSIRYGTSEVSNAIQLTMDGVFYAWSDKLARFKPWCYPYMWRVRKAIDCVRDYAKSLLVARRNAIANNENVPDDVLNYLVKMKEEIQDISDEEIIDEQMTFFLAGMETTSSLLALIIFALGQNIECMNKLVKEVDDVVGKKALITRSDIAEMPYLDMVIKETLRLYPAAPFIMRVSRKPLHVQGHVIPEGSNILLSPFTLGRTEKYFKDPLSFIPERFSPDAEQSPDRYVYFPFAIGPHTCLGKHFAEAEVKIAVTKLFQRYSVQLAPNQSMRLVSLITLRPAERSQCILRLRED